jgi:Na+/H+-dicarboxylate symporter
MSLHDVSMKAVIWAMVLAPAAVFGLLAQICVQTGFDALLGVSAYVVTLLAGLLVLLLFYLLLFTLLARLSTFNFLRNIRVVQLLPFRLPVLQLSCPCR